MKTKYKWIRFEKIPNPNKKTTKWICINTSLDELGEVYWHRGWRQYVFFSYEREYNNGCMNDIANFLTQLNIKQKDN